MVDAVDLWIARQAPEAAGRRGRGGGGALGGGQGEGGRRSGSTHLPGGVQGIDLNGVRAGGLPVERDVQFWIDVLVREGKLKEGQLAAKDVLFSPEAATN